MAEEEPQNGGRRARMWDAARARGIPLPTILATVGVVVLVYLAANLVFRLRDIILLILVAGFIAVLLNPIVVALQRWRIRRRGWAVAVVTLWALLVFTGLAAAFGYPIANTIGHLADTLPSYVSAAEHGKGWIGHLVRRYHVQAWVQHNEAKLVDFGRSLAKPALTLGKGAFSLLISLLTIFVLVLLMLLEGPKMRSGVLGLLAPARAERYSRVAREVNRSVTGYMLGNLLTSLICGGVVLADLLLLGIPFPFLWALWVALVDFLPMIGGALAGIPVVLFAAFHSLTAGIVTLAVFLIYTQIENHLLNPVVMSRTVRVNPLLVLLSVLVGASIGSWIGGIFGAFVAALIAIPSAGAIQVLVREIWHSTAPERQAERASPGPGTPEVASADPGTPGPASPVPGTPGTVGSGGQDPIRTGAGGPDDDARQSAREGRDRKGPDLEGPDLEEPDLEGPGLAGSKRGRRADRP